MHPLLARVYLTFFLGGGRVAEGGAALPTAAGTKAFPWLAPAIPSRRMGPPFSLALLGAGRERAGAGWNEG